MIDDWVEGHVFSLQVSLSRLHVVGAVVTLNEALKLTIHYGTMSQGAFLTWESKSQRRRCQKIYTSTEIHFQNYTKQQFQNYKWR